MKQVIFVCLLSLSVCLSQPNSSEAPTQAAPAVTEKQQNDNATESKVIDKNQPEHLAGNANEGATKPPTVIAGKNASNENTTKSQNATGTATGNETSPKPNDTKAADNTSSATVKPKTEPESKEKNETKTTVTPAPTNGTNADGKDGKKNETSTPKGDNVSPTAAPVEAKTRAFDGPSFIGGIILTLGLLAIGFMGFKYYKNQTERNYHTL